MIPRPPDPRGRKLIGATLALAIATVGGFEGVRYVAYRDSVGIPTICYGETRGVHMGDRASAAECKRQFTAALGDFASRMNACLVDPASIPDKSYVAFLSLAYNIGTGAFCRSSVARDVNSGRLAKACDDVLLYDHAGGRRLAGLTIRRRKERALCMLGIGG
ncbi:MAG: hypothetical protein BGN85_08885 [Alphaproteobacteria bacterium 64-11]|nr:MAG: hypothetical protein BGN85_08885 [Alphaproteobacteria bacterium 64-11]